MNVQDYRAAGFNLSIYIDEAALARAESDVKAAYIAPLVDDYDEDDDPYKSTIMVLAYLLIMQRSVFATRAGGKQKNAPQSNTPTQAELLAHRLARAVGGRDQPRVGKPCKASCRESRYRWR